MSRVKAENAFSASDYFSTIFELITNRPDINMEDLSGTELEVAETELFRRAIADSIRMNLWLGDKSGNYNTGYNSFDGLLKIINERVAADQLHFAYKDLETELGDYSIADVMDSLIRKASPRLKGLYNDGQVAFFVSPSIYQLYEIHPRTSLALYPRELSVADPRYSDAASAKIRHICSHLWKNTTATLLNTLLSYGFHPL